MRDELLALLTAKNPIENVDSDILAKARSFFRTRFGELLGNGVLSHPLGFFYASERIGPHTHLRYHLWPNSWKMPTLEEGREDHDHTYNLSSLILAGELRHRTFEAIEDSQGTHEILDVSYRSGDSVLQPTGRSVRMVCSGDDYYPSGRCYRLQPGTIHRAVPVKLPMATIVMTTDGDHSRKPRVLAKVGDVVAPTSFHRGPLNSAQIQTLNSTLEELS